MATLTSNNIQYAIARSDPSVMRHLVNSATIELYNVREEELNGELRTLNHKMNNSMQVISSSVTSINELASSISSTLRQPQPYPYDTYMAEPYDDHPPALEAPRPRLMLPAPAPAEDPEERVTVMRNPRPTVRYDPSPTVRKAEETHEHQIPKKKATKKKAEKSVEEPRKEESKSVGKSKANRRVAVKLYLPSKDTRDTIKNFAEAVQWSTLNQEIKDAAVKYGEEESDHLRDNLYRWTEVYGLNTPEMYKIAYDLLFDVANNWDLKREDIVTRRKKEMLRVQGIPDAKARAEAKQEVVDRFKIIMPDDKKDKERPTIGYQLCVMQLHAQRPELAFFRVSDLDKEKIADKPGATDKAVKARRVRSQFTISTLNTRHREEINDQGQAHLVYDMAGRSEDKAPPYGRSGPSAKELEELMQVLHLGRCGLTFFLS